MKILDSIIDVLKTITLLLIAYLIYSASITFDYHIPTMAELFAIRGNGGDTPSFIHNPSKLTSTTTTTTTTVDTIEDEGEDDGIDMTAVCELVKRGFMVQSSTGALVLCITSGVMVAK